MLIDPQGRTIDYLRFAVTDRCNLRCTYCMPEQGLKWIPRKDLLSDQEAIQLLHFFSRIGIKKLRFTGGEPFMRPGFLELLRTTLQAGWFESVSVTTNGTLCGASITEWATWGLHSVNLSLDSLDAERFHRITRRNDFEKVRDFLLQMVDLGIPTKVNAVIREGENEADLISLAAFTKEHNVAVRFIEEMPFNGEGNRHRILWTDRAILEHLTRHFGVLAREVSDPTSTSVNYRIAGHAGTVGVIAAFSRNFCASCNRIRLTPSGKLRTCLYEDNSVSLLDPLRSGADDSYLLKIVQRAIGNRAVDGFEAESRRHSKPFESMATIGG
jgi:molybdenum cofactor biosynthesis protein A